MINKIKKLMEEKGVSAYKLSKDIGIPQSTISSWNCKKSNPSFDKLKIIAEYFGVSVDYFV